MVKKILLAVVVVLVAFLGFVATRPSTYHVERSATVPAPVPVVHGILADLGRFKTWSPWEKLDPNMKTELSTPSTGVGATYFWESPKDDVGSGRMTITGVEPDKKVTEKLEFLKPFESTATLTFSTEAAGAGTKVTWAMDGDNNFMAKLMGVFMSMDEMIGKDFEEGLANLTRVAGEEAKKAAEPPPAPVGDPPPAPEGDAAAPEGKG